MVLQCQRLPARKAWRKGLGRALYTELLGLLARQQIHSVFAGIALPNAASIGLHEAMGFVHLGTYSAVGFKFGAWRDVGWWQRRLIEGSPSQEPIPFRALTT
jgi:phosphinothricin acetyltransferase